MEFRPCIDIHDGRVKQIVGGSLVSDSEGEKVLENFVAEKSSEYYAELFSELGLYGGHVIMLDRKDSTKEAAISALKAFPGGLQIGGGLDDSNAKEFIDFGASCCIFTSYIFHNGLIDKERLIKLTNAIGKEHIVLDLSCKRKGDDYLICTDRWQNITEEKVTKELLLELSKYCNEFLIHAADVEGKKGGVEKELIRILGEWKGIPVTYAGGVGGYEDIELVREIGQNNVNLTIGSALDIYGGNLSIETVMSLLLYKNVLR